MQKNSFNEVKKVLIIILFLNIAVALAKVILGLLIKSASVYADGVHSITDGTSNIIGIIGISLAATPKDAEHPYGHRKIETMTGLFIVAMLVYLSMKIITEAIVRFSNLVEPNVNMLSFIVMLLTFFINLLVTKYEHKKGMELKSLILTSDAMHTKSDLYVTLGVIITLCALKLGAPPIVDPLVSIVVAAFILKAAFDIFKNASQVLIDRSVVDCEKIKEIAMNHSDVIDVHNIRSRGTTEEMHIDMHVLADPELTLTGAHDLAHSIEKAIREVLKCYVEVIVHVEPFAEGHYDIEDEAISELKPSSMK